MPTEDLSAKRSARRKSNSAIVAVNHAVVSHEKWLAAKTAFLEKEKDFIKLRDELSRQRANCHGSSSIRTIFSRGRTANKV